MPLDLCPDCGTQLTNGLCPRCLVKLAIEGDPLDPDQPADADPEATQARNAGPDAPRSHAAGIHTPEPDSNPSPISITAEYRGHPAPDVLIAGRYALREKIGEGGMGEVWVAKQSEPVKRKVALKLIKPGMDSRAVLQRFEQERQALALMDHPNIARVLDAGMTPNGQPFFVMELVNGLPLNKFCDELKLTPKERLELFVPICQAVQHAHQKGIVHRDLKPANILITMIDGKPVPKVIDFGVAKATAGKLTDESMSTQFGAVVGTLEYMSPEQAGFSGEDIDTRADIYSLGVILYELLTGLRPIDAKRLQKAAMTEMIRIIREEEPSRPSTRLSTDEALPSLAALRQTEPRKLMAMLRGELDWVVMKCLEKHRERRYETANALARDIQRYLADEAVEARPPSAGYRFQKFVTRNKRQVIAASVVLLTLIGGIIGTSIGLVRADRARRAELSQRLRAEAREKLAIDAVTKFRDAVANNDVLKNNPALESLRKTLLKEPLEFFRSLREQLQSDQDTRPDSLARLADAIHDYAHLSEEIGDVRDSLRSHEESLPIWQRLVAEHPHKDDYQVGLGRILNCRGNMQASTGQVSNAFESYGKALAIFERLARENPTNIDFAHDLALSHHRIGMRQFATGQPERALESVGKAMEIRERLARENPTVTEFANKLAESHADLGVVQNATGQPERALESYGKAVAIQERLARDNPAVTDFASGLGLTLSNSAVLYIRQQRFPEARQKLLDAITWQKKALSANPRNPNYRQLAQQHYANLQLAAQGLRDDALALDAKRGLAELAATDPRFQALDGRLAAVMKGEAAKDNPERLALAQRAYDTKRYALAARLWSEAMGTEPKLGDDRTAQHRYNAACAAALAVRVGPVPTARPVELALLEPKLEDTAKARLRKQALDWLRAELAAWKRVSMIVEPGNKEFVATTLAHWKQDADLASIRDEAELAKLPEAERKEWQTLWADVDALLKRVVKPTS
jgi:eukaryotic-like serine/threonine-protein kinase